MDLLKIYADEAGETHFRRVSVELAPNHYVPPSPPIEISTETPVTTSLFLVAPQGWDDAFHATPRRQYAVLLSGDRAGVLGRVTVTRDRRLSTASPDPWKQGPATVNLP